MTSKLEKLGSQVGENGIAGNVKAMERTMLRMSFMPGGGKGSTASLRNSLADLNTGTLDDRMGGLASASAGAGTLDDRMSMQTKKKGLFGR